MKSVRCGTLAAHSFGATASLTSGSPRHLACDVQWRRFAANLSQTAVAYMYASEHHFIGELPSPT